MVLAGHTAFNRKSARTNASRMRDRSQASIVQFRTASVQFRSAARTGDGRAAAYAQHAMKRASIATQGYSELALLAETEFVQCRQANDEGC